MCKDNKCITLEELYNILNNRNNSSSGVPLGARITIGSSTYSTYFDSTGLGSGIWEGWALSNGNNGTVNRLGKFVAYLDPTIPEFDTVGKTGGANTKTLTTTELPTHTHSFSLPSHNHSITDSGHTHSVNDDTQLAAVTVINNSSVVASVANSFQTTLNKQQIRVEDSVAPANPKNIEVFVPTVDLQAYVGLTSASVDVATSGTGSVTIPAHNHTLSPSSLAHAHSNTVSSNTSGISSTANSADVASTSQTSGAGQAFSILPTYIVEVPIEKII